MSVFCKGCSNILDISRSSHKSDNSNELTPTDMSSSDEKINYKKVIDSLIKKGDFDKNKLSKIDFIHLQKQSYYKKKSDGDKKKIKTEINRLLNGSEKSMDAMIAYNYCDKCSYEEEIKDKQLIISRANASDIGKNIYFIKKLKNQFFSDILPFTREYNCPNSKCKSHRGIDHEAKFFREQGGTSLWYQCMACQELWKVS
jgi:hypothetical protein